MNWIWKILRFFAIFLRAFAHMATVDRLLELLISQSVCPLEGEELIEPPTNIQGSSPCSHLKWKADQTGQMPPASPCLLVLVQTNCSAFLICVTLGSSPVLAQRKQRFHFDTICVNLSGNLFGRILSRRDRCKRRCGRRNTGLWEWRES
jgi:hypothetical protein